MEQLQERIQGFSDEHIIQQYLYHKNEYKPEALEMLKKEIERRNIDASNFTTLMDSEKNNENIKYESENFENFKHVFSKTDILLAVAILKENEIIFYVDNTDESIIPVENQAFKTYTIHVHKDSINQANQLIDEHFEKSDGRYLLKINSSKDRLKAFSFHDLHLSEKEDLQLLEVTFTNDEKQPIISYAKRLLDEVDQIEQSGERVIFYYDSIDELINVLQKNNTIRIRKSQLLAILEILQIYCDDSAFPDLLDTTISNILGFFID